MLLSALIALLFAKETAHHNAEVALQRLGHWDSGACTDTETHTICTAETEIGIVVLRCSTFDLSACNVLVLKRIYEQ